MAITAETRQDIMELAVAANNAAPGTTLLSTLVAMSESGSSLLDIANELANSASFKATYPTFQTATEFATEFLGNLVPEAGADAVAEGVAIIEGMLNSGASRGEIILEAASYLAAADESNAAFGSSAALFNNRVEVAVAHTITNEEADSWDIPASVTSDDDSVATGTAEIPSVKAAADAAAAKAAEEKAAADAAAAAKAAEEKAAADAAAAEKALTDASAAAAAAAAEAIEAAEAADAAVVAAQAAYDEAAATAAETDAVALAAALEAATTADTDAKAAVVTAQAAYDAALLAGVALDVSTANGELLIAQNNASLAAAALVEAAAASEPATAADEAAATAAAALADAKEAATAAADAADAAAAAAVTAAAATADTDDDAAAAAQVVAAAAADPVGDAAAEAAAEKAAAEKAAADKAAADKAAADKAAADKAAADKAAADEAAAAEAARLEASTTKTLTINTDNFTTAQGDDLFDASLTAASVQTLTTVDSLNGGDGSDTLNATLNNGLTIRPTISNIETLAVNAVTSNSTMNLASTSGVTSYKVASSSADLTLTNMPDASATISAIGNSGNLSFGYTDAALAAASQTVSLTLDGQSGGITFTDAGGVVNKLETIAITSSNTANSLALTTANVGTTSLTVAGDANLTLSSVSTGITSVDAGTATGNVNVTASVTTSGFTFTGGTGTDAITTASTSTAYYDNLSGGDGNDTFTLDADGFSSKDTIDGGAGTADKITFTDGDADATTDADFTAVTNVERLQAQTGQALTATLGDKAAAAGIALVVTSTGNDVITAEADYGPLNVSMSTGNDKIDNALSSAALTATAAAASITANDTITGGSGSSDKVKLTADSDATGAVLSSNVTLIETFEFAKSGDKTAKLTLTDDQATALKTLTVDGSALTGGVASFTLDASAEATATATLSVTGSEGGDTITLGTSKNSVVAGGGSDSIRFGASTLNSADTIDGGDGTVDSIVFVDPDGTDNTDVAFSIVDADLVNVSNIERLTAAQADSADAANVTITLGANALAAGITSFVSGANTDEAITMATAFAQTLTYSAGGGDDSITANASGVNVSFTTGAWDGSDTITGGTGTDTITVTNTGAADFSLSAGANDFTGVEKITVVDKNGYDYSITTDDANIASGKSLEFDGSGLLANTGAAEGVSTLTVDASAETNGTVKITGGASADVLTGGAGVDTIIGGGGNDQITGGTGYDDLQGGDGNDNFVMATEAAYVATSAGVTSSDTVVGGDGTDTITFSAAVTLGATDLINITEVEVIDLAGSGNTMVLTDAVMTGLGKSELRIDAGGTTGTGLVLTASALTSANSITVYGTTTANVDEKYVTGAGNDVFRFDDTANVLEATDTITAGAGEDRIDITFDGLNAGTVGLDRISGVESVVVRSAGWSADNTADDLAITVTNTAYDQATLTVDASAIGAALDGTVAANADTLTFDGSGVTDTDEAFNVIGGAGPDTITGGSGADTVVGGSGADQITGGIGLDNLSGGSENDTFVVGTAGHFSNLSAAETVSGGGGTDTLQLVSGTYSAADFGAINDIERISMAGGSVTLADSVYTANGEALTIIENGNVANTIVAGSLTSGNAVTVVFDATTNDTITLGAGNDIIRQTDEGANEAVAASDAINGGAGDDTLFLHVEDAATTSHTLAAVTNVETIKLYGGATANGDGSTDVVSIVTAAAAVAAGATMTIDISTYYASATATAAYAGDATIDGSAETGATAGKFVITGGSGADTITTGAGADTINGGAGADTIDGGIGVDSIVGGTGADKITGGTKADIIYGGTGADRFVYTAVTHSGGTDVDNVADWNSTDDVLEITLDYSSSAAAVTVNATQIAAKAGLSAAQAALSGERGQFVYDTTNSVLYVNVNNDNLITSLDYTIQLAAASTASSTVAATDIDFVITGGSAADTITTGSGADTVDGGAAADTIVTGAGADNITAGTGADTITSGTGLDTVALGASGDADYVQFSTTSDGGTVGTDSTGDTITGFVTTEDKIRVTGALATALDDITDNTALAFVTTGINDGNTGAAVAASVTASNEMLILTSANSGVTTANLGDVSVVATALETQITLTAATGDDALVIVTASDAATKAAVYLYVETGGTANQFDVADLTLLGIITSDAQVVAGDFITT